MNQLFAATAALLIAAFFWGRGRKPGNSALFNYTGANTYSKWLGNDKVSVSQFHKDPHKNSFLFLNPIENQWKGPINTQERLELQKHLKNSIKGSPEQRLEAVKIASLWGHSSVLEILRRGLRDSDNRVVAIAAAGLGKKKGTFLKVPSQETRRPPRNVSRMR